MATKTVKKELLNDDIKVKLMSCANCKFFYSEIDIRLRNLSVWFFFSRDWIDRKFIAHALNIFVLWLRVGGMCYET